MVTVERTAEAIIFKVPATLDDEAVRNIEKYISEIESPVKGAADIDPKLPFGEGFDEEGFVTDPVILDISQKVNHSGLLSLKDRFKDAPEFAGLFNTEEE
jgi:hypothetical protein